MFRCRLDYNHPLNNKRRHDLSSITHHRVIHIRRFKVSKKDLDEKPDYIIEKEPLVNKFISRQKDKGIKMVAWFSFSLFICGVNCVCVV